MSGLSLDKPHKVQASKAGLRDDEPDIDNPNKLETMDQVLTMVRRSRRRLRSEGREAGRRGEAQGAAEREAGRRGEAQRSRRREKPIAEAKPKKRSRRQR